MLRSLVRRVLFRYGWDTRCRHWAPSRSLREATATLPRANQHALLDVGCGRAGMAAFLPSVRVMGVDLERPENELPNRSFTRASITELPFPDRSFPYVSCIDVLQELSEDARELGIAEMLRVAQRGLVIAAPNGAVADRCDAEFDAALRTRGAAIPAWVAASRANPYPTPEAVVAIIERLDPEAEVTLAYFESAPVTSAVRATAVRSPLLYAIIDLIFGILMPLIPTPDASNAYRFVLTAYRVRHA